MADHSASGGHGATLEAVDGTSHATVQRFRLRGVEGVAAGQVIESTTDRCTIGTHASCDLVLDDPTVSRFHCEIRIGAGGARIVDLGSRNGTVVDTVRVRDADLRPGQVVRVGRAGLRFEDALATNRVARSERVRLGDLVGASPAMRATYALLERAAAASMTVLLEGETGTGKTLAAYEIHRHGARADGPFVTVDAGAIPATLLESELFGHERGAFTGADALRRGAFEEAAGGTLLLDEVGELPLELQTKLLRFLEHREVRRVGGSRVIPVDVRVVAATHRDLRVAVNEGRFRADLYYRLAVVTIRIPPLRERRDDLPAIVDELLAGIGATAAEAELVRGPEALAALTTAAWPGNVREPRLLIVSTTALLTGLTIMSFTNCPSIFK